MLMRWAFLGMMTLRGVDGTNFWTFGSARASSVSFASFSRSAVGTDSLARSLPFT